jgi:hypothetical protein
VLLRPGPDDARVVEEPEVQVAAVALVVERHLPGT